MRKKLTDADIKLAMTVKCRRCGAVSDETCTDGGPGTGRPMKQVTPHPERAADAWFVANPDPEET